MDSFSSLGLQLGALLPDNSVKEEGGLWSDCCRKKMGTFLPFGSAPWRGVGTPILGRAKDGQAASGGRLMRGLSLNAPIVSSVI